MFYKILYVFLALYGAYYYVSTTYKIHDALVYAQKHPDPKSAPRIIYYVGFYHYQKSEYPQAQEAFTQLLLDYPTCQYEASALFYLGDVSEQLKNWDLAKSSLARYVERFPSGKDREIVSKKLELIKYHHGMDVPEFPSRENREQ